MKCLEIKSKLAERRGFKRGVRSTENLQVELYLRP